MTYEERSFRVRQGLSRSGELTMAISLYDLTVANFLQTLGAVDGFLAKGLAHCKEKNIDPNEIVETRLYADMLPFRFQVLAAAHHSPARRGRQGRRVRARRADSRDAWTMPACRSW